MALPVELPDDVTYCLLGDCCALCWQQRMGDALEPLPPSMWGRIIDKGKRRRAGTASGAQA